MGAQPGSDPVAEVICRQPWTMHLRAGCFLVLVLTVPCGLECVNDELCSAAHDSLGGKDDEGPCMKKRVHRYTKKNDYATCRLRRDLSVLERSIAVFKLRKVCTISAEKKSEHKHQQTDSCNGNSTQTATPTTHLPASHSPPRNRTASSPQRGSGLT